MIITRLRMVEGDRPPRGWGLAWFDFHRQQFVVMPIPLNLLAGAARRLYLWARAPFRNDMTLSERACFDRGFQLGRHCERDLWTEPRRRPAATDAEARARVAARKAEVASHGNRSCYCHPIELDCCARGRADLALSPETVDALDSNLFAWHVDLVCRVETEARERVRPDSVVHWIGGPAWRDAA